MDASFYWWIACGLLVGAELLTGTFYLLVLAVAAAGAALAAHAGGGWWVQCIVAAILAVLGTFQVKRWRLTHNDSKNGLEDLDAGQTVRVVEWLDAERARVAYRGSTWDATLESASVAKGEIMMIRSVRGTTLVLGSPDTAQQAAT